MRIIQKSGGRSVVIRGAQVTIDGRKLPQEEATQVLAEAPRKIAEKFGGVKPSPTPRGTVVIVRSFNKK